MSKKLEKIKVISFDGDGTLWDFEKLMRHSLNKVIMEFEKIDSETASKLNIEKMIEIRNRVAKEMKGRISNLETIRYESFRETLKEVGNPDDNLADHLNNVYRKHRFENIELFEDVLPTLKILQKKYIIGLISNGNSFPKHKGLEEIFSFVIFSQDFGIEKPNPRIFQIAMKKADCSYSEIIHVGDSLESDVQGGENAGIKSVWVNRNNIENDLGINVDYEIKSVDELFGILL